MPITTAADADKELQSTQQAADEAAGHVTELRQRVRDADPKATPDAMLKAQATVEHAALRIEGAAERAERAREADRLRELAALHDEIQAYTVNPGRLASLASKALSALTGLHAAIAERSDQVQQWRTRMTELGVPEHGNPMPPSAAHGRIGHNFGQVIAGEHRVAVLHPDEVIGQVLAEFCTKSGVNAQALARHRNAGDIVASLAAVDGPPEPVDENMRFFLTTGGGSIAMDREPSEAERLGIVREISRAEAWGA